jgi:hypothetical protein
LSPPGIGQPPFHQSRSSAHSARTGQSRWLQVAVNSRIAPSGYGWIDLPHCSWRVSRLLHPFSLSRAVDPHSASPLHRIAQPITALVLSV